MVDSGFWSGRPRPQKSEKKKGGPKFSNFGLTEDKSVYQRQSRTPEQADQFWWGEGEQDFCLPTGVQVGGQKLKR